MADRDEFTGVEDIHAPWNAPHKVSPELREAFEKWAKSTQIIEMRDGKAESMVEIEEDGSERLIWSRYSDFLRSMKRAGQPDG